MPWKTRKRQRGGVANRAQSACPVGTENYKDMALHAIMDMVHDHGSSVYDTVKPLVRGHREKGEAGIGTYASEEQGREYFFSADKNAVGANKKRLGTMIPNLPRRYEDRIEFLLNEKNAYFRDDQLKGFVRFFFNTQTTNNSTVGIVQDNGELIYKKVGGYNLLTFGSILDQAKKPKSADSDPIYMQSDAEQLRINACEYGINKFVPGDILNGSGIDYIQINGFRLAANIPVVKCYFGKKSGAKIEWTDAINPVRAISNTKTNLLPEQNPDFGQDKYINIDEISKAGYFTSIAKIADVEKKFPTYVSTDERKRFFYLGKFFGDTSLVASVSPQINISTDLSNNPFYNLNNARWIFGGIGRANPLLENVMLKTFDQLNFVRAVIKGRPVVYQQAKTAIDDMYFFYMPGEDLDAGIKPENIQDLITRFTNTINQQFIPTIEDRYNNLISLLNNLISVDSAGNRYVLKESFDVSNVHKEVLNTVEKQRNAAVLVQRVIDCLQSLRNAVVASVNTKMAEMNGKPTAAEVKNYYKYLENIIPNYTPFTNLLGLHRFSIFDILLIKQKQNESLLPLNGNSFYGKLVLRFKEAFEVDPSNQTKLKNTPLFYNFLDYFNSPQGGGAKRQKIEQGNDEPVNEDVAEFEDILRQDSVEQQIIASNKELIHYLCSYSPESDISMFEILCILTSKQYTTSSTFIDYIDSFEVNLQDSYPLFYKFHTFTKNILSKVEPYTLFSPLIQYLITISSILECINGIQYIYDTILLDSLKTEAIYFFVDLIKLNIDTDNINEIQDFILGHTSGYEANVNTNFESNNNNSASVANLLSSPTASSHGSPLQRPLSRLSAVSELGPLPEFTSFRKNLRRPSAFSSIIGSVPTELNTTRSSLVSSKRSSELSFLNKSNTSSNKRSGKNKNEGIGLALFNNTNSNSSSNSNFNYNSNVNTNSGYAANTEYNTRKNKRGGGKKIKNLQSKKNETRKEKRTRRFFNQALLREMKMRPQGLHIVGSPKLIHRYVTPLLNNNKDIILNNLYTFKTYNTILQSSIVYNRGTRRYIITSYEGDDKSSIAISINQNIAQLKKELAGIMSKIKNKYRITRAKFYILNKE